MINLKNINYSYPDGMKALKQVNFNIKENETLTIIGPNGAGKTTLLLSICGVIQVDGIIEIFNEKLTKKNVRNLRKNIGFVFQDPDDQLFMPTVYEDVAFGPENLGFMKDDIKILVCDALDHVGLKGFENRESHHLSFGEKKKVSFATILAMDPKIIILDEPTSNLDPYSRREFIKLLKKTKATKIIATHDLEMVLELSDRTVLINKGKIISEGITHEILSNKDLMENNYLEIPLSIKDKN